MNRRQTIALRTVPIAVLCATLLGCPSRPRGTPTPEQAGGQPPSEAASAIQVKGSDTLLQLAQNWAEVYQQSHPQVEIAVTGGGSGTGIAALLDGNCDIADASREIKEEELKSAQEAGVTPVEHVVAHDAIAVIVNSANPVEALSISQLSDVFAGKVKNWKDVGGADSEIVLLIRDTSSGTHVYFKEAIVNRGSKLGLEYAPQALPQISNQGIHDVVMKNEHAIGYIGLGYLDDQVKALKVIGQKGQPGVAPSIATVKDGSYPISRPLYCYTNGEPTGALAEYLSWCLGAEGQAIVQETGFVPAASGEQS